MKYNEIDAIDDINHIDNKIEKTINTLMKLKPLLKELKKIGSSKTLKIDFSDRDNCDVDKLLPDYHDFLLDDKTKEAMLVSVGDRIDRILETELKDHLFYFIDYFNLKK